MCRSALRSWVMSQKWETLSPYIITWKLWEICAKAFNCQRHSTAKGIQLLGGKKPRDKLPTSHHQCTSPITVTSHELLGVSNHWQSSTLLALLRRIHQVLADSPQKVCHGEIDSNISAEENAVEVIICKIWTISLWPQCLKSLTQRSTRSTIPLSHCTFHFPNYGTISCAKFCSNMIPYNGVTLQPIFQRIWIMKNRLWNGPHILHTPIITCLIWYAPRTPFHKIIYELINEIL